MAARVTDIRDDGYTVTVDATCRICGEDTGRGAWQWRLCRACRPEAAREARARRAIGGTMGAPWDVALEDDVRAFTETRDAPSADLADFLGRVGAFVAGGGE